MTDGSCHSEPHHSTYGLQSLDTKPTGYQQGGGQGKGLLPGHGWLPWPLLENILPASAAQSHGLPERLRGTKSGGEGHS